PALRALAAASRARDRSRAPRAHAGRRLLPRPPRRLLARARYGAGAARGAPGRAGRSAARPGGAHPPGVGRAALAAAVRADVVPAPGVTLRPPLAAARLALVSLASLVAGCGSDPAALVRAGGVEFERLALYEGNAPAPPPDAEGGWRDVALPDFWALPRRLRATQGWYRADFEARPEPAEAWAIAAVGDWTRLSLVVNDRPVAEWSAGDVATAGGPGLLYARIPKDLLHDGSNRLALHYAIAPASIGQLNAVQVGPARLLAPPHQRVVLLRATLPFVFTLFGLASGALVLALSRWDPSGAARWFAAATIFWSAGDLSPVLRVPAGGAVAWAFSTLAHAFVPCLVVGFHPVLGLRRPRVERVLAASLPVPPLSLPPL